MGKWDSVEMGYFKKVASQSFAKGEQDEVLFFAAGPIGGPIILGRKR